MHRPTTPLHLLVTTLSLATAFKYESNKHWDLAAPNTLCASGIPGGLMGQCPRTKQEVEGYDAIVMDEHGYVDVTISGLYFTDEGGRRLEDVETSNKMEAEHDEKSSEVKQIQISAPLKEDSDEDNEETESKQSTSSEDENDAPEIDEINDGGIDSSKNSSNQSSFKSLDQTIKNTKPPNWASPDKFHIQIYLVSLDAEHGATSNHISHTEFLSEKGMCCYEIMETSNDKETPSEISELMKQCVPMDMRPLVPRVGTNQRVSVPLSLSTTSSKQQIVVSARFRPEVRGRYMVVVSNCAAKLNDDGYATPLTAHFTGIKFKFASKFGELPLSMSGIVPFYGVLLALYGILGLTWFKRSQGVISCPNGRDMRCKKTSFASGAVQARPLMGLQRAIYSLILLQFVFTLVAFAYYVHLNITVVDIGILYGGTMAALAACQAVLMLATDGTWLIQSSIRPDTKKALYVLGIAWACFFATNTLISRKTRLAIVASLGLTWATFLVFNVRRSLRHLRSLILGQSNETVVAVGGNLVAKRSMYRKFFAVLAFYPIVFAAGVVWNVRSQEDSWAWVGYVLMDVYVFIILLHASITWLPRPFAAGEYAKYTPLDQRKSSSTINDRGVWEEIIDDSFDELELS
eukprot:scaffold9907_cov75-Cyclotella_meneghiniana.AAC.1